MQGSRSNGVTCAKTLFRRVEERKVLFGYSSNLHRVFDFFERLVGHLLRAVGAGFDYILDLFGIVAELDSGFPDGGEFGDHGVGC